MKLLNIDFPDKIQMGETLCTIKDVSNEEYIIIGWFAPGALDENQLRNPPYIIKIRRDWEEMPKRLNAQAKIVRGFK